MSCENINTNNTEYYYDYNNGSNYKNYCRSTATTEKQLKEQQTTDPCYDLCYGWHQTFLRVVR